MNCDQLINCAQCSEADVGNAGMMYYLNDGVYGSFNCILFDHVQPIGQPLRVSVLTSILLIFVFIGRIGIYLYYRVQSKRERNVSLFRRETPKK